ncbi:MAG: hypothetical protein Q8S13_09235 [Dehalococcoidia bacterium]|nr:hypothetical protein [Dehalococcoidia bacterium]
MTPTAEHATVVLGYVHPGFVAEPFMASVLRCYARDIRGHQHLRGTAEAHTSLIAYGRNIVVGEFLKAGDAEWLWMADTDIGFAPDALCQLVEAADPVERPIVAGLAFVSQHGQIVANWARWDAERTALLPLVELPSAVLSEIDGCGMAFTLIHRNVLEALLAEHGGRDPGWAWFGHDQVRSGGIRLGEDYTFCLRAQRLGFKVWGHRGPFLDHYKVNKLNINAFARQEARQAAIVAQLDQAGQ